MQCIAAPALTAIVLCGGRGVRMGGRDKPLMDFRGRPLVAHVCRALEHSVSSVLISANRNLATYAHYGIVVQDELADAGPLSGISSCLNSCATAYAFICPGDAPNLDQSMVQRLARSLATTDVGVVVAHDGRRRQNLHLLLRSTELAGINAYLTSGARSVKGWLETTAAVEVNCADLAPCFADIDEPDDVG